jgi:hypothetical protein
MSLETDRSHFSRPSFRKEECLRFNFQQIRAAKASVGRKTSFKVKTKNGTPDETKLGEVVTSSLAKKDK